MNASRLRLPVAVRLRTWTLDAAWTRAGLQELGLLHALAPILRRAARPAEACGRYMTAFNMNTWTAPAVVGAIAQLESQDRGADALRVRDVVAPPLSGAGDAFVWTAVRPACSVLALGGVLVARPVAALAGVAVLHAALLAWTWTRGFAQGAALGAELPRAIGRVRPSPAFVRGARTGLAIAAGALVGGVLVHAARHAPSAALGMGLAAILGYTALRRRLSPELVFVILVVAASVSRRMAFTKLLGPP